MKSAKILSAFLALFALIVAFSAAADELNTFELNVEEGIIIDGEYQVDAGGALIINVEKSGEWENATVEWESSNAVVALVNSGVVYAQTAGGCTITATATNASTGNSITASIKVRVNDITPVETVVSVRASGGATSVEKGNTLQMLADVFPVGVSVSWSSSRPKVILVDDDGLLLGIAAGKSIITATAQDGSGASDSVVISVNVVPKEISINYNTMQLYVGGTTSKLKSTGALKASVKPAAADDSVTWTSSNNAIVRVGAKGKVFAQKKGTVTITATTINGLKDKCTIKVYKLPTVVWLPSLKKVYVGKKLDLAKLLKINGDVTSVNWYTSNKKIATVTSKGVVKGIRPGQCRIMVKAVNGKKDVCIMNVYASKGLNDPELLDDVGIYDGMPTDEELAG